MLHSTANARPSGQPSVTVTMRVAMSGPLMSGNSTDHHNSRPIAFAAAIAISPARSSLLLRELLLP